MDDEWVLRPGDVLTVYPEMISLFRTTGYDEMRLDIGYSASLRIQLESMLRAVAMGESEMVYVIPDERKEQNG